MRATVPDRGRWLRRVGLAAAVALLVGHALVFDFVNDDAFISFRYADNLVRHGELVFNPGERVEGYTNFLWTMVLAGVLRLGLDPVPWSKALGVFAGALTLLVVARFSARRQGSGSPWDLLAPVLLAAAPAYACWSTGGLETALFTLLLTLGWSAWLLEREEKHGFPWSGVWFALSALTRPEGILFFGLTGLIRGAELLLPQPRRPARRDWLWGGAFAAVFLPYFAWRWSYYGWPWPNTWYVKSGASNFWGPGGRYVWSWVRDHHLWAVPLLGALAGPLPGRRRSRLQVLAGVYTVALMTHVARIGGDFMALNRFLVPTMPALALVAAEGFRGLAGKLRARLHPAALVVGALVVAGAVGSRAVTVDRAALVVGSDHDVDSIGYLKIFAGQCTAIGRYLRDTAPPGSSIATTAAGIIPYYSRLYALDMLGLNDAWIAHEVPSRGNRPGHTKIAPIEYMVRKKIDYILYHPEVSAFPKPLEADFTNEWKSRGYVWEAVQVPELEPPWWACLRRVQKG